MMSLWRLAVAFCVATASVWMLAAAAGAVDDGIACGSVITTNTVLTHDVRDCVDGLTIAAPDVTLDLSGHHIEGLGAGTGVRAVAGGAVVENGTIRAFGTGIVGAGVRVEGVTIQHNGAGIVLGAGRSGIVDNRILDNDGSGVTTNRADGSLISGNVVMHNGGDGLHLMESVSTVLDNTLHGNGGDGLEIDELCGVFLNAYRVGSNVADGNGGLGMNIHVPAICPDVPFDLLDAGGNAAKHNGDPRECTIQVDCAWNRGQAMQLG